MCAPLAAKIFVWNQKVLAMENYFISLSRYTVRGLRVIICPRSMEIPRVRRYSGLPFHTLFKIQEH